MQRILSLIESEPVAFWLTFATTILGLAAQFGLPVSQDVKNGVLGVIGSVYVIAGLLMRNAVTPNSKAQTPPGQ